MGLIEAVVCAEGAVGWGVGRRAAWLARARVAVGLGKSRRCSVTCRGKKA